MESKEIIIKWRYGFFNILEYILSYNLIIVIIYGTFFLTPFTVILLFPFFDRSYRLYFNISVIFYKNPIIISEDCITLLGYPVFWNEIEKVSLQTIPQFGYRRDPKLIGLLLTETARKNFYKKNIVKFIINYFLKYHYKNNVLLKSVYLPHNLNVNNEQLLEILRERIGN